MPKLIVEKGFERGRQYLIHAGTTLISGRREDADVHLTDAMASRDHFRIEPRDDGYQIIDLDSRNGTYINGKKIAEHRLKSGDHIQVGETVFSFLDEADEGVRGDLAGRTIGGYRIEERIGRGGMGTVYRAVQLSLDRIVALKILSPDRVKDERFRQLFLQEARAAGKLNHPNIVAVYDVGQNGDIYYYSMEFISGGSLRDLLDDEKKMDLDEAINAICGAAAALEYAEKMGIVHRDIKPDNLMLAEGGEVKVCDLGLAKDITPAAGNQKETVCGSPLYLSPEQAQGRPADHRSDIYSLGATFYRLLAGVPPFSGKNIREIFDKHVKETPLPISRHNPDVPPEIERIIARMLEKDPDKRFASATSVLIALNSFRAARLTRVGFDAVPGRWAGLQQTLRIITITVVAASVLAAGAYLLLRRGPTRAQELYSEARQAFERRDFDRAGDLLGQIITRYKDSEVYPNALALEKKVAGERAGTIQGLLRRRRNELDAARRFSEENKDNLQAALDRFELITSSLRSDPAEVQHEPYLENTNFLEYAEAMSARLREKISDLLRLTVTIADDYLAKGQFKEAWKEYSDLRNGYPALAAQVNDQIEKVEVIAAQALQERISTAQRLAQEMKYGQALELLNNMADDFWPPLTKRVTDLQEEVQQKARARCAEIIDTARALAEGGRYQAAIDELLKVRNNFGLTSYIDATTKIIDDYKKKMEEQAGEEVRLRKEYLDTTVKGSILASNFKFQAAAREIGERLPSFAGRPEYAQNLQEEVEAMNKLSAFKKALIEAIEKSPNVTLPGRGVVVEADEDKVWIDEGVKGTAGKLWQELALKEIEMLVNAKVSSSDSSMVEGFALLCMVAGSSGGDFDLGLKVANRIFDDSSAAGKNFAELAARRLVSRILAWREQGPEGIARVADLESFLRNNGQLAETEAAGKFFGRAR